MGIRSFSIFLFCGNKSNSMSFSVYLWMVRIVTVATLCVFLSVVWYVDPDTSGIVGPLFFFGSLFVFLSGAFTLFLLWIRKKSAGERYALDSITVSIRQGILLTILAIVLLFLESQGMLVWWDGLILVISVFLVELYYLIKNQH